MQKNIIKSLNLTNFRLHQNLALEFSPQKTLLLGPNASGKTAIIEAIFLASTGDSFRATRIEQMIHFGAEIGRVNLLVKREAEKVNEAVNLEVLLTRGVVQAKKTQHRLFRVNEVKKRKKDFIGQFKVVLFRPEDMRLVEGSPARRRGFLDQVLSQVSWEYASSLKTYENTLRRRNRLLPAVREGEQPRSVLQFWNLSLIKHGQIIQEQRRRFLDSFKQLSFPIEYQMEYLPKVINETAIDDYLDKEIASGHSLIGPHKDDFNVLFHPQAKIQKPKLLNTAIYGSRGQQRLAVLWLKAGESQYLEKETGHKVVWLLDDILSELDVASRTMVTNLINQRQVIITSASKNVKDLVEAEKVLELGPPAGE